MYNGEIDANKFKKGSLIQKQNGKPVPIDSAFRFRMYACRIYLPAFCRIVLRSFDIKRKKREACSDIYSSCLIVYSQFCF